jgi:hypothetical protein
MFRTTAMNTPPPLAPRVISVHRFIALTAVTLALVEFTARPARADHIALGFNGGAESNVTPTPATIGWAFTTNSTVIVTQLGFFDITPATLLSTSHAVGIWTSSGLLLGSSVVQTNSPITNGFRYVPTSPFQLNAGQNYVIGAFLPSPPDNDNAFIAGDSQFPLSTTTDPAITYGGNRVEVGNSLTFPDLHIPGVDGFYGPNFQFTTSAVPAPPAVVLVGLGAGCVALRRYVGRRATA